MLGRPITLFKIWEFEIKIDLSWLILAVLVTWSLAKGLFPEYYKNLPESSYWWMGAAGAVGLFLSIILHELSHSIVARKSGMNIKGITLFIFGGVSQMEDEPPDSKTEFLMAAAGPLASILIGIFMFLLYYWGQKSGWPIEATGVFSYLAWINMLLAVFNLMPAFPLDGGRVLRSILWKWKKDLRWATNISARVGSGFGIIMIILGIIVIFRGNFIGGMWWILIGLFLRSAAQMSFQQLVAKEIFLAEKVRDLMVKNPLTVPRSITLEEFIHDYVYKHHFKMFPVISSGKLAGCISVKQAAAFPKADWSAHTVGEIMQPLSNETVVGPEEDAFKALAIMNQTGNSRLMVVDEGQLVGIIALKDMFKLLSLKMAFNDVKQI
ncbi:MAG: site-2 protease family protein [Smithella sp.]